MKDLWNLRTFRNDLSKLIEVIEIEKVTGDFSELQKLLVIIDQKERVEYKIENLCFFINGKIKGTLPEQINYYQVYFDIMVMIKEELNINSDPLGCYNLDITVKGYENKSTLKKDYSSRWHLDKHNNEGSTKYTHPIYHFQFGGKKMELIDTELSVLSSPRIPHPPMDIFLGFHFIISNFFNAKQFSFVNSLLANYEYLQIIKRAQVRLWKPYFGAFDPLSTHTDFTMNNVFPLYIN